MRPGISSGPHLCCTMTTAPAGSSRGMRTSRNHCQSESRSVIESASFCKSSSSSRLPRQPVIPPPTPIAKRPPPCVVSQRFIAVVAFESSTSNGQARIAKECARSAAVAFGEFRSRRRRNDLGSRIPAEIPARERLQQNALARAGMQRHEQPSQIAAFDRLQKLGEVLEVARGLEVGNHPLREVEEAAA